MTVVDSWICAFALAYDYSIVSLETYQESIRKRIKIPNVCESFGIEYIDIIDFMRKIRIII